jgi:hypothetical protein
MVDLPRFNSKLAQTIEEEGGIEKIIITHSDNIEGHEKWKARFPDVQRIIHRLGLGLGLWLGLENRVRE